MDSSRPLKELTCFCCGRKGQGVTKCSVCADVICHSCGKKGHLKKVCKAKGNKHQVSAKQKDVRKLESEEFDAPSI